MLCRRPRTRQAASPAAQLFLGVVAHGLKMHLIAVILLSAAGVIAAALLILVRVELHQDRILNEIAQRENEEAERRFRPPV